jgi:hypothetical protein
MSSIPHTDDGNQTDVLPACMYKGKKVERNLRMRAARGISRYAAETRRTHPEAFIFG